MLCGSLEEILSEQEMTLRHPATSEDFTTIFQAQMVLMFEWVEKLPEFRMLCDHNDKVYTHVSLIMYNLNSRQNFYEHLRSNTCC